jgi:Leucine-rich repeat (LRR) protein
VLSELRELRASHNSLFELPPKADAQSTLSKLIVLDLSYNHIQQLDTRLGQLRSLTHLDCSHNRIATISDEFRSITHLKTLKLNSNQLNEIPQSFEQLLCLSVLDLSDNLFKVSSYQTQIVLTATGTGDSTAFKRAIEP